MEGNIRENKRNTDIAYRERTREEKIFEYDSNYLFQTYTFNLLRYLGQGYDFATADNLAYKEAVDYEERNRNQARQEFLDDAVKKAEERREAKESQRGEE